MPDGYFSLTPSALDHRRAHLPLLLLDIDGCLNAYDFEPDMTVLPANAYTDLTEFQIQADDGSVYRFWTSPQLVRDITAVHEEGLAEVAWLTTWQEQANRRVSPALGLPRFPVVANDGGRFSDYYWKSRAAVEAIYLDRPIVWIDDADIDYGARRAFESSDIPHLLIEPRPAVGLTQDDVATIRAWLLENL